MNDPYSGIPNKQALLLMLGERARRIESRKKTHAILDNARAAYRAKLDAAKSGITLGSASSLVTKVGSPFWDLQRKSRYKIYFGGRDSAKSWAFAEELVRRAVKRPLTILCTREFQASIADSVHRLLRNTISRLGFDDQFEITEKTIRSKAGANFIFKGLHHNSTEIKSTEGVDIVWVEEAHNTSEESWRTLIPTIRKKGSEIWMSFNVSDEEAPTHKRFVLNTPPDAISHFVTYKDNPYLSPESLAEIAYLKEQDPQAFDHVYGGLPLKFDNAIIFAGKWREFGFNDELSNLAERQFYGADFGYARDPATLIHSFVIENVLYVQHEAYGHGIELEDYEAFYKAIPGADAWPIKADSARPEIISFLLRKGFNIAAAEKWNGSVEDGITHIRGFKEIVIHPRCKYTIQEMKLYSFKKDKVTGDVLPVIIDRHNHCADALRYSLDGYIQRRGIAGQWARLGKDYYGDGK